MLCFRKKYKPKEVIVEADYPTDRKERKKMEQSIISDELKELAFKF